MDTHLRNINKNIVAGLIIILGFTSPILITPFSSSFLSYKNYSWFYDTGGQVTDIAISYDNSYYVIGTTSKLLLFHKSYHNPIWEYDNIDHMHPVSITANGKYFAGVDWDNLYVFSIENGYINQRFIKASSWLHSVEFSRNGEYFVVTDYKTLFLYSTTTFSQIWSFTSEELFGMVKISSDGSYIVAVDGNYLYMFSKFSNTSLWRFPIDNRSQRIAMSANGRYVVLGEYIVLDKYPKTLYLFNRDSDIPIWSCDFGRYITSIAISDDGSMIAAGNSDGLINIFSSISSKPIFSYDTQWGIEFLSISSNGRSVVAASTEPFLCLACVGCPCSDDEGEIYVFNFDLFSTSWWNDISRYISSISISSDGRFVLMGSYEKIYYFQNKY
ncbi:MAG: WD40 repeat domain-containing protein [Candidatus Thorarchaeota archaeon]